MPTVAISDIRPNPVALRSVDRESEAYIQLRDSVADPSIGLLNPINVRERTEVVGDETVTYFEIIDGLHRYTACCEAGFETIEINIKDFNETEAHLAQIIGNAMRIETKPVQYTKHLQRIISSNPTWTMNDLAARVHRSPAWLNQRFGLLKLNVQVQEIVDNGDITVSNAVILAKLPHDEQLNFIDSAMTMGTAEFGPLIQNRVKEILKAEKEGKGASKPSFTPVMRIRKRSELEEELESRVILSSMVTGLNAYDSAYLALAWSLNVDPVSVEIQKAEWTEKQRRLDDEKKKRTVARAQKKAEEAAAAAVKAQEEAQEDLE